MNKVKILLLVLVASSVFSCTRVDPGYTGVLMQNFGKTPEDYSIVTGRVWTIAPGTFLYQVPTTEKTGELKGQKILSSSSTAFQLEVYYIYNAIASRATDIVTNYRQYDNSDDDWFDNIEVNSLNRRVGSVCNELASSFDNSVLLFNQTRYKDTAKTLIRKVFEEYGFDLNDVTITLTANDALAQVVNDQVTSVERAKVLETKKREEALKRETELANAKADIEIQKLKAESRRIESLSLSNTNLQKIALEGWIKAGCPMPYSMGNGNPATFLIDATKK